MAKKTKEEEIRQQNVAEAVSKTEVFFKENSKTIIACVIAVLVIALAILAYSRFYLQPKRAEAQAEMFHAEQWFAQENYELALAGDDNYLGFEDIIAKYGAKGGESVYMYAGLSALLTGDFEKAVNYLKKYDGKDPILKARALAALGDAYVGLTEYKSALAAYDKAIATADNIYAAGYMMKAGVTAEEMGDNARALGYYKAIKDKYPAGPEGAEVDKYIARIETAE